MPVTTSKRPPSTNTWSRPGRSITLLAAAALGSVLVGAAPEGTRLAAVVAVFNLAIIAFLLNRYIRGSPLLNAPLIAFLPGLGVSWPVTMLFFSSFHPDAAYLNEAGATSFLAGAIRYQLCLSLFLVAYSAAILLTERSADFAPPLSGGRITSLEWRLALFGITTSVTGAFAALPGLPEWSTFVLNGLRNFGYPLILFAGLFWTSLSTSRRTEVIVGLLVQGGVNTLGNSRGQALLPAALFAIGLLFSPGIRKRTKAWLIVASVMLFPFYLVLANQSRLVLGNLGLGNADERVKVLRDASQGTVVYENGGVLLDAATRLFLSGGQAIVNGRWDHAALSDFDPAAFIIETGRAMLPSYVFGRPAHSEYLGSDSLRQYGFTISDSTSVEVSLVGSLFGWGGLGLVFIGGLVTGLVHRLTLHGIIATGRDHRAAMVAGLSGMASATLWAWNLDLGSHLRALVWSLIYIALVVLAFRVLGVLWPAPITLRRRPARPPGMSDFCRFDHD